MSTYPWTYMAVGQPTLWCAFNCITNERGPLVKTAQEAAEWIDFYVARSSRGLPISTTRRAPVADAPETYSILY